MADKKLPGVFLGWKMSTKKSIMVMIFWNYFVANIKSAKTIHFILPSTGSSLIREFYYAIFKLTVFKKSISFHLRTEYSLYIARKSSNVGLDILFSFQIKIFLRAFFSWAFFIENNFTFDFFFSKLSKITLKQLLTWF